MKIVLVEGTDGVGKTTLVGRLEKSPELCGPTLGITRTLTFPTPRVRSYLLESNNGTGDPVVSVSGFMSDMVSSFWALPPLHTDRVVCDRSWISTAVYNAAYTKPEPQLGRRDLVRSRLLNLHQIMELTGPWEGQLSESNVLLLLLEMDPGEAKKREKGEDSKTLYSKLDATLLKELYNEAALCCENCGFMEVHRIKVTTKEAVYAEALKQIRQF